MFIPDMITTNIVIGIVLAAVSRFVVGMLWYSPLLFGKSWQQITGIFKPKVNMALAMLVSIIGAALVAAIMSCFMHRMFIDTVVSGKIFGFMVWLGFVLPLYAEGSMYEARPLKLFLIDNGYQVISLVIMGALIAYYF